MDAITKQVKDMYEKYSFPNSNVIDLSYGERIKADLIKRNFNVDNIKILDAGCGTGEKVISLAKVFSKSEIFGWDICENNIEKARQLAKEQWVNNICFECNNILNLELDKYKGCFDVVISWGVIHHLSDSITGLRNLGLCLKNNGLMYIWVYALNSPKMFEMKLFHEAIDILFKKEKFSYEKGLEVIHAIRGLLRVSGFAGRGNLMGRIKWFFRKDVSFKDKIEYLADKISKKKKITDFDITLVDSFLHPYEKYYDIDMILMEIDSAGLVMLNFLNFPKDIDNLVDNSYVQKLFSNLDLQDRLRVIERIGHIDHHLFVVKQK